MEPPRLPRSAGHRIRSMLRTLLHATSAIALLSATLATASETISYGYDARGRLVQVARSGTVNNGVTANYAYDNADNRSNVTVSTSGGGGGTTYPSFSVNDVSVTEGGSLSFTVTKTGTATTSHSVTYATADGTALAGSDYTAQAATTLTFAAAETVKTVTVPTTDDTMVESSETVLLNLSNATGGATISDSQGVGTINDNDTAGTNSPPTTVNDTGSVAQCETAVFNVTANDTDAEGNYPLTVTAVTGIGFSVFSPSEVQFSATQSTGAKTGTYTVKDSLNASATGTLTVTVTSGGTCTLSVEDPVSVTTTGGETGTGEPPPP